MPRGLTLTFVVSSLRLSGGVHAVVEYASRLAARRHQVTIVVPRGTIDTSVRARLGDTVSVVEVPVAMSPRMGPLSKVRLSLALARAIPGGDVVCATHTPTTPAAWWAHRRHPSMRLAWLYQDYREMFHGRPLEQVLLRAMPRLFDPILTVSQHSAEEIRRWGARRVAVVRQGISDEGWFQPPASDAARTRGLVLTLGDMRPRKGLFDFLAASRNLHLRQPSLRLAIVSKDECRIDTPVPFHFYSRPPRRDLAELMRRCAVFVSASWWESFGLPPLEAMACGAPVVLTESRGVGEYARPGENCLMVPPRDPQALAEAIERLLRDGALAERLSAAGPATARGFGWEQCVDRFETALVAGS